MSDAPRPQGPGRRARPRPRRSPLRVQGVLLVVFSLVAFAMAGGSGWAIYKIKAADNSIQRIPVCPPGLTIAQADREGCIQVGDVQSPSPGTTHTPQLPKCFVSVCNYLILGSDSRAGLTKGQQSQYGSSTTTPGQRSDTIMLVHVDFPRNRTTILSIPRDLRVNIPGHGIGKVTSAFDYGPNTTIKTIEQLTGLTIDHYIAIDFDGFMNLVNAVGGVRVCVPKPMRDTYSGLNLPHAGCYNMDGHTALQFVRARHVQGDIIPDFDRIARQQQFMRALMEKVTTIGTSLLHYNQILSALRHGVVFDEGMNLYDLQDLARKLDSIGQSGVAFRALPAVPVTIGGIDYVELQQPQASRIFSRLRHNQNLGNLGKGLIGVVSPAQISVRIYDANSGGNAQKLATYLGQAGFDVLPVQTAPSKFLNSKAQAMFVEGAPPYPGAIPLGSQEAATLSPYLPGLTFRNVKNAPSKADITIIITSAYHWHL